MSGIPENFDCLTDFLDEPALDLANLDPALLQELLGPVDCHNNANNLFQEVEAINWNTEVDYTKLPSLPEFTGYHEYNQLQSFPGCAAPDLQGTSYPEIASDTIAMTDDFSLWNPIPDPRVQELFDMVNKIQEKWTQTTELVNRLLLQQEEAKAREEVLQRQIQRIRAFTVKSEAWSKAINEVVWTHGERIAQVDKEKRA